MQGCSKRYFQQGVGLMEVLVSLLVITIGVLGMAGLQGRSLQYNQVAYLHSQAAVLATDMLDRIRVNRSLAQTSDSYQVSAEDAVFTVCSEENYPENCESNSCSPVQLAAWDIQQWKFRLSCQLPGTEGVVNYQDTDEGRVYSVHLIFTEDRGSLPMGELVLRSAL